MDSSLVYLVQTDTTVGFLSYDNIKLSQIKKRPSKQKILMVVDSFKTLKLKTRVPKKYKRFIRKSNFTTIIYPNLSSFRVVDKSNNHHSFIKRFRYLFSTSANITKKDFNEEFAVENSDIILYTKDGFSQTKSSSIYKVNKNKIKKVR
ncbi:MAG: Sua5 YciO YrdC YwlC family protein [Campylobacterota bacterium]|nr:Sua5 YciO YrdC YwlC family protein [Campylobacterota bacterium]